MENYNASSFFKLSEQEVISDEWEVLDDDGAISFGDIVLVVLGLLMMIVPGLIMIAAIATRPKRTGYLCLTNWRCLYLERGTGRFRSFHRVGTIELDDVVAVHSVFEQAIISGRSMTIRLHSRHEDSMLIKVGDGGLLSKVPVVGPLFRRSSIGKDALVVAPSLYNRIRIQRNLTANMSSGFNKRG